MNNRTTFGYDSMGNRQTVTDALGHTTTALYDGIGRVTSLTVRAWQPENKWEGWRWNCCRRSLT
jgi:hypothetical protein